MGRHQQHLCVVLPGQSYSYRELLFPSPMQHTVEISTFIFTSWTYRAETRCESVVKAFVESMIDFDGEVLSASTVGGKWK